MLFIYVWETVLLGRGLRNIVSTNPQWESWCSAQYVSLFVEKL